MQTMRELRERKALSQRDLAGQADVSRTTIANIEAGGALPIPSIRRKIAAALGVAPDEIDWPGGAESALEIARKQVMGEDPAELRGDGSGPGGRESTLEHARKQVMGDEAADAESTLDQVRKQVMGEER